jgi:lipopolysaccharide/colanic/teichoic acid biosynthesis glycosyltransferase
MTTDTAANPIADGHPMTQVFRTHADALNATICDEAVGQDTLSDATLKITGYFQWKSRATRVLGAVLLVLAIPAIVALALLVWCTSYGPAFYRQCRVGKNGRKFYIFKLRTMHEHAETTTGPTWCQAGDLRITPVGRVLRFFHWDELPQLLNVARGEMDLVGPRPERPELIKVILKSVPGFCDRLQVLPGVTGLAQVNLPADTDMESARAKLALDLEYIRTATAGLDTRIVICSALRMLGIHSGCAVSWLQLERSVTNGVSRSADSKCEDVAAPTNGKSRKKSGLSDTEVGQGTAGVLSPSAAASHRGNGQAVKDVPHALPPHEAPAARFRTRPK